MTLLQKKFPLKQSTLAFVLSSLLICFHNFFLLLDLAKNSSDFFAGIIFHFSIFFFIFFFAACNKTLLIFVSFLIFLFACFSAFVYSEFGISLDSANIANGLQNAGDASSFFDGTAAFIYAIIYIILPLIFLSRVKIIKEKCLHCFVKKTLIIFVIASALNIFLLEPIKRDKRGEIISSTYSPISLISGLATYYKYENINKNYRTNLGKISEIIPDLKIGENVKNLKIILVIGESARSQNFSLNGYVRLTNPLLAQEKNLISFSKVKPCFTITSQSVLCLTSYNANEFDSFEKRSSLTAPKNESVIKAFSNLGFKTSWFSNQQAIGGNNALLLLASQADKYFFRDSINKISQYDEVLLPYLESEINDEDNDFIVLQGNGSHFLFDDRYPENFRKFTPNCLSKVPKHCAPEAIVNSYDNSILYTDYFLSEIIQRLKNKKALVIYISDHGQFLGENGLYYHGDSTAYNKVQHEVPMILWMSPALLSDKKYSQKFNNAKNKIHKNLSHDNIFDSLLNCAGAEAKIFKRNLSICQ
jgi:glucan phosphoethanolaminetransferase (alkaline phosphatase superfamily)